MPERAFKQVDVFTAKPLFGNALAVILDGTGLSARAMQRIAAWTNLSETTFVLPPTQATADYRVRIFTPRSELPFAGHPSVGTAHALIESGALAGKTHFTQECAAGLLPLRVAGRGAARKIFVRAPTASVHPSKRDDVAETRSALRIPGLAPTRLVNVGPDWLVSDLGDEASVRTLLPDMGAIAALCRRAGAVGLSVFGRPAVRGDYALCVRAFCPADGIPEDPVTGSANAAIGAYLRAENLLEAVGVQYRVSQGREIGRDGFIDVTVDAPFGAIEIGGQSVTCVNGTLRVD